MPRTSLQSSTHLQGAELEVDVGPLQAEGFALAQPERQCDLPPQRVALTRGDLEYGLCFRK